MRALASAVLASFAPPMACAETNWAASLSDGYRIVSMSKPSEVIVEDRSRFFRCMLEDRTKWVELRFCIPIMTASQRQIFEDGQKINELKQRLAAVDFSTSSAAIASLFSNAPCETLLGRDVKFEPETYAEPDEGFEDLEPARTNLPSMDEVLAREAQVAAFGSLLGFQEAEVKLIGAEMADRFHFALAEMIKAGDVTELRLGAYKLNGRCN